MNYLAEFKPVYGYIIVVANIIIICVVCALARKRFKIGTYTEEEKANMKSSLELLMKEEDVEEGKDYRDEV